MGVDNYFAAGHSVKDLEALVEAPRPAPKVAEPIIELLDEIPAQMRRPLELVNNRAYAAVWLPVKSIKTESENKQGEIVRHDPPIIENKIEQLVIRSDGKIFGLKADATLNEIGFEINLLEKPPPNRGWSTKGVTDFRDGYRATPKVVFNRLVAVIDRFVDFDRSLADQQTMCEMVACYVLTTWFLDAFDVIGFIWSNGDAGSGKTQLLKIIAELSYLGILITSGGSFASLRDMADYGATLAFDDAENFSNPKKSDPDKRSLLLAGNRRGVFVSVKELVGKNKWQTRYVNAFCPRLFSAISLPDNVLASRAIVVPLIRTPDDRRSNSEPLDYELWPNDRHKLIDDLWALAVDNLAELKKHQRDVKDFVHLKGRALEPWQAILAIAGWLDTKGVDGLLKRIEKLSCDYQKEKPELETSNLTVIVIKALCHCASCATCATTNETTKDYIVTSAEVAEKSKEIASEMDSSIDLDTITSQRVGIILGQLRLKEDPRPGGKGSRRRKYTNIDLERWSKTYGIGLPDTLKPSGTSGTAGTSGTDTEYSEENISEVFNFFDSLQTDTKRIK